MMKDKLEVFKARDGPAKQFPAKGKAKKISSELSRRFAPAKNDLKMKAALS